MMSWLKQRAGYTMGPSSTHYVLFPSIWMPKCIDIETVFGVRSGSAFLFHQYLPKLIRSFRPSRELKGHANDGNWLRLAHGAG